MSTRLFVGRNKGLFREGLRRQATDQAKNSLHDHHCHLIPSIPHQLSAEHEPEPQLGVSNEMGVQTAMCVRL